MVSVAVVCVVAVPLTDAIVTRIVRRTAASARPALRRGACSVAFVAPARMRTLNRLYRHEDRVTDVLAFGGYQGTRARGHDSRAMVPRGSGASAPDLGELVVCPAHVRAQAKRAGESFRRELARVLVHGTLHLLGYDHARARDAEHLFALQEAIVRGLRVA